MIKSSPTALPGYYTTEEAAQALGYCNSSYISRLCKENRIMAYKVGTIWLIPDKQVEILSNQPITGEGARGISRA